MLISDCILVLWMYGTEDMLGEAMNMEGMFIRAFDNYKVMADALGVAYWDVEITNGHAIGSDSRHTYSQSLRRMLGFTDENDFPDVLSSWSTRLHNEDKLRVDDAFEAYIADHSVHTPYSLEYRLMTKGGEYRYYRSNFVKMQDDAGTFCKISGTLEDITDQMRRQLAMENILNKMS